MTDLAEVVRSQQEAYSDGDKTKWLEFFGPAARMEDPVGSEPKVGHDDLGAFWDEAHAAARSVSTAIVFGPFVCGSQVALGVELTIDTGEAVVALSSIDLVTFNDAAEIVEFRGYWGENSVRFL